MRVCFDITCLYVATSGIYWYDYNLARAMVEVGRDDEFVFLDYRPIHGRRIDAVPVADLAAPNSRLLHLGGFRHYKLSRWAPFRHPLLVPLARGVDRVLQGPLSRASGASMRSRLGSALDGVDVFRSSDVLLWRQPGALNVCTVHDLTTLLFPELHTAENRELQEAKFRYVQEVADVVIADSEATKRDLIAQLSVPAERIHVVYSGVDPAYRPCEDPASLRDTLEPLGLAPQEYILHVGTIEPRKNLRRLVEAYAQMRAAARGPVPLLALVGPTGWYYREVFERVTDLGLEPYVRFVGQVPFRILPALYAGALYFAYPSLYEGFGLPPLEAMASGVPVLTSNVSSLPEVVGDAAVMVDPTDIDSLVSAMTTLLTDADLRASLRQAGLVRARRFSWQRAARETLDVYRERLGG